VGAELFGRASSVRDARSKGQVHDSPGLVENVCVGLGVRGTEGVLFCLVHAVTVSTIHHGWATDPITPQAGRFCGWMHTRSPLSMAQHGPLSYMLPATARDAAMNALVVSVWVVQQAVVHKFWRAQNTADGVSRAVYPSTGACYRAVFSHFGQHPTQPSMYLVPSRCLLCPGRSSCNTP